jgi:hypothetical protein
VADGRLDVAVTATYAAQGLLLAVVVGFGVACVEP